MKSLKQYAILTAMLASFLLLAGPLASAQAINSTPQNITLTATLPESLTLNLSGNAVSFNLIAGSATNAGSSNITATTTWLLKPSRTAVKVYAYFTNAAAALTDGATPANNIPSSAFSINANPLVNTVPFGGALAGLQLSNTAITAANRSGNHADVMSFNINLTTLPQLPANPTPGYQGTLSIEAQATP